jgi:hypothetical protein
MTEIEQLQALSMRIDECLCRPGVQSPSRFHDGAVELLYHTDEGVEYEIRIKRAVQKPKLSIASAIMRKGTLRITK